MSNKKINDEEHKRLMDELQRYLDEGGFNFSEEEQEDFGYYYPGYDTWDDTDSSSVSNSETPPPVPKEARVRQCKHERIEKRYLINSHFYICLDCKKDFGDKI